MKTTDLFFSPLCRAKSRRDDTLLTVCDSLRAMKTAKLFLSPLRRSKSRREGTLLTVCFSLRAIALMIFSCASLHAQVTMGGLEEPKSGAILDLNSTVKGGLLLSNVALDNLYTIPATFPGMITPPADVKEKFKGAIVFHTGANNIPAGVYVWNGTNWTPAEENCTPLDAAGLKLTPSVAFAKVGDPVTFFVSSGAGSRCAEGETYDWHVNGAASETSAYPASTWTASFAATGDYKVKVMASNLYDNPLSRTSSNEATVYVTDDGSISPALVSANYRISGGYCYDVRVTQQSGETDADFAARVDSFATGFTKTFRFTHTEGFQDLQVLIPDDPDGIVESVSQPATNSGNNSGSLPFTVTFNDNVKDLVVNNGPAAVKLLVSYTDNNSALKIAYLNIRVQDAGCYCPAQVPSVINRFGSLVFMCRNLGATEDIRSVADIAKISNTNFRSYHGDWYRFGAKKASLTNTVSNNGFNNSSTWNGFPYFSTAGADWPVAVDENIGNPCPDGWRLPTVDEWAAVINQARPNSSSTDFSAVTPANNMLTPYKGSSPSNSWSENNNVTPADNFANVMQIGDYLFFPAAGYRYVLNGLLSARGYACNLWSSTTSSNGAWGIALLAGIQVAENTTRPYGLSVRCVRAE
jgi:uncharacterized protein (TIGR02145 family)